MCKLAAAIHNYFVVVRYIGAEAPSSRGPRAGFRSDSPRPSNFLALFKRRSSQTIDSFAYAPAYGRDEAMSASLFKSHLPASTLPLSPNCSLASLAGKVPAACSQLQRMGR